ncbi:MAG: DMT family transporter [Pseudomonadota bacterium]
MAQIHHADQPGRAAAVSRAVLLVLLGMGIIGFIDNFIVVIAETASLWQFNFLRAAMSLPVLAGVIWLGWGQFWPKRPFWVFLRTLAFVASMFLYFGALGFVSIGQALAGLFTAPLFVLVLGALFLGQPFRPLQAVAVVMGFSGVLMVLQPATLLDPRLVLPVSGGVLYAINGLITRIYCSKEDTLGLLTFYNIGMCLCGALGVLYFYGSPNDPGAEGYLTRGWGQTPPVFWALMCLQAAGALVAVWCLTRAYQLAPTGVVSVSEYSVMIFGPLFAALLFGDVPNALALFGLAVIIGAGVWMTRLEIRAT